MTIAEGRGGWRGDFGAGVIGAGDAPLYLDAPRAKAKAARPLHLDSAPVAGPAPNIGASSPPRPVASAGGGQWPAEFLLYEAVRTPVGLRLLLRNRSAVSFAITLQFALNFSAVGLNCSANVPHVVLISVHLSRFERRGGEGGAEILVRERSGLATPLFTSMRQERKRKRRAVFTSTAPRSPAPHQTSERAALPAP